MNILSDPRDESARRKDLRAEARAWLLLLSNEPTSDDKDRHAAWLREGEAHRIAWDDAQHGWRLFDALGGNASAVNADVVSFVRRRRAFRISVASVILAALLVGNWAWRPVSFTRLFADGATRPGEQRTLVLEDGTRIALNGATAIDWKLTAAKREVTLAEGEAYFDVAHDPARPFYVLAGKARIRVTGTRFSVQRLGADVIMELAEGHVLASQSGQAENQLALSISPGEGVTWDADGQMHNSGIDPDAVASWRSGRLFVRARPLGDVLEELNLYWGKRVLVSGTVSQMKVSGAFLPANEERTLRDLGQSLPIRIQRIGPVVIVRER